MIRSKAEYNFLYQLVFTLGIFDQNDVPQRNLMILEMRWKYNYSFEIIGKQLDISSERAAQLYQASLDKLLVAFNSLSLNGNTEVEMNDSNEVSPIHLMQDINPKIKAELSRLHIHTLEQLASYNKNELMKYKRIGKKTIDSLEGILKQHHLSFLCN